MNNPIEYIEKCTLDDLLEFRENTYFIDKNGDRRNSTRLKDLIYIANFFIGYTDEKIAKKFKKSLATVRTDISICSNGTKLNSDKIDDLMREIAYWKYKQLCNE